MAAMLPWKASSAVPWAASGAASASTASPASPAATMVNRTWRISELRSAAPPLRDDAVSRGRGMDPVSGPILRRALVRQVVEHLLERDEGRSRTAGDALGCGATLVEFGEPAIVHRAAVQHERLEHDDPGARQGAPGIIEQGRVLVLVVLDGAGVAAAQLVPEVVHADQDAQHVRR